VDSEVAIACAGVAAGGLVQSATGFGFALIAAPVVAATLGPVVAVPTISVASLMVSALTLAGEGRRPVVLWRTALVLIAAGLPGMVAGAVILANAPEDVLKVLLAVIVAVSAFAVTRVPRDVPARAERPGSGVGAGALAGLLATTSGINGPTLVLHLRRLGVSAIELRDTLAVIFLATGVLTVAVLAAGDTLDLPTATLLLVAAAAVGQALGRRAFFALEGHRDAATHCVLALSVAAAAVPAVQALA
jgi:uncharacterized protein